MAGGGALRIPHLARVRPHRAAFIARPRENHLPAVDRSTLALAGVANIAV
jgi:hypothetical protein